MADMCFYQGLGLLHFFVDDVCLASVAGLFLTSAGFLRGLWDFLCPALCGPFEQLCYWVGMEQMPKQEPKRQSA